MASSRIKFDLLQYGLRTKFNSKTQMITIELKTIYITLIVVGSLNCILWVLKIFCPALYPWKSTCTISRWFVLCLVNTWKRNKQIFFHNNNISKRNSLTTSLSDTIKNILPEPTVPAVLKKYKKKCFFSKKSTNYEKTWLFSSVCLYASIACSMGWLQYTWRQQPLRPCVNVFHANISRVIFL